MIEPELYVGQVPDGKWEKALRRHLAELGEGARLGFLAEMVLRQNSAGLAVL